jgi:C4-dicarboxylate-specific signal transduction histidine kinase
VRADWQKLLRSIRAGAERTAAIVADLKSFARTGGTELAEADLVGGIDTTLNLIAPLLQATGSRSGGSAPRPCRGWCATPGTSTRCS